jgi:anti-sigma factor RsiW
MSDIHDCEGDAAPYVLGALDPDEASRFEEHLRTCAICQDEVASMRELTDSLAISAPQMSSPRRVRRRVMKQVRADAAASKSRLRWSPARQGFGVAAAGLVAAVIVVLVLQIGGGSSTQVFPASVGKAEVRVTDKRAELVVHHLRHLGPGHVYEVWLSDGGKGNPQPTNALFDVSSQGNAEVRVPGDIDRVKEIMVTKEPAGGSAVPTTPVVVAAEIN